jgi:hypothetical protein
MGIRDINTNTNTNTPAFEEEGEVFVPPSLPASVSPKYPNQVTTGIVRLVYPSLAEPRPDDAEIHAGKYTCMVLIPKSDEDTYNKLKAAAEHAATEKFKRVLPNLRMPIKDGDEKFDKDGEPIGWYADHWYLNLSAKLQPKMIDPIKRGMTRDEVETIKGGDWVRVRIAFAGYDSAGNKGVGSYVNVVQFIHAGDALGGGDNLDDFDAIDTL